MPSISRSLETIVAGRAAEAKSRDQWRHPIETLTFFGLQADHFVVELMPGDGMWYTDIIAPFVASQGQYGAVNFDYSMITGFLPDENDPRLEYFKSFEQIYPKMITDKFAMSEAPKAFDFADVPETVWGNVDLVLITRELHAYFLGGGAQEYLQQHLQKIRRMLKPDGVVGVVQHRAVEEAEGKDSNGAHGYLKQSDVIELFEAAGFVLEEISEINANPKDRPLLEDRPGGVPGLVWRLPPTYSFGDNNKALYESIGESDRMTLRFRNS